jgi:hypothetical protein
MKYHRTQLLLDQETYRLMQQRARTTSRTLSELAREYLRRGLEAERSEQRGRLEALRRLWVLGDRLARRAGHPASADILERVRVDRIRRLIEVEN